MSFSYARPTNQFRTIIGSLTTTFTPAPTCTIPIIECSTCNNAWQAQTCFSINANSYSVEDNVNCWPPRSASATTPSPPFFGWGFYSPGLVCPTGLIPACSATGGGSWDWAVQYSLLVGRRL